MRNKGWVIELLTQRKSSNIIVWIIVFLNIVFCAYVFYKIIELGQSEVSLDYRQALNALSVFALAFFTAIFLSFWPKTRDRFDINTNNAYPDPSFLVLSIVTTVWNGMLFLEISPYSDMTWAVVWGSFGDIVNSAFFLLAALQFDFDQTRNTPLKEMVLSLKKWLNGKSRITILTIITSLLYIMLFSLEDSFFANPYFKISKLPIVLYNSFVLFVLVLFLDQLYRERKFTKIRYGIYGVLMLTLFIVLTEYLNLEKIDAEFEINNSIFLLQAISSAFYRFALVAIFLLLGFSFSELKANTLRNSLLDQEVMSGHFIWNQIGAFKNDLRSYINQEKVTKGNIDNTIQKMEAFRKLNFLVYKNKAGELPEERFQDNLQFTTNILRDIFFYQKDGVLTPRVTLSVNNELSKVRLPEEQQLDLFRIITELVLNADKYAYQRDENKPGEIEIKIRKGKINKRSLLIYVKDKQGEVPKENLTKIDKMINSTISFISTDTTIQGAGWKLIKGIIQVNNWGVKRLENPEGLTIQINILLS